MSREPLADLLASLGLVMDAVVLERLEWLGRELLRWNRTYNLTAITDPAELREKHLVDSLTLLPFLARTTRLLDLGSGAGFPALPLKIARPELEVVSVDAVGKKIAFQRHVARTLHLEKFTAIHGRAEALSGTPACAAGFDVVTARALGNLSLLVVLAAPCLAPGGRLIAMKGGEGLRELADCAEQLQNDGWMARCHRLTLPGSGAERTLIVLEHKI
jgi:16S rRNA (guanine527-N7)-methyltransferase